MKYIVWFCGEYDLDANGNLYTVNKAFDTFEEARAEADSWMEETRCVATIEMIGLETMFNYERIKRELADFMEDFIGDFDADAIMDDLRAAGAENSIDDIDYDDFVDILNRREL